MGQLSQAGIYFSGMQAPGALPDRPFGLKIVARIGEGARSVVYYARQNSSGRPYALKHVVIDQKKDHRYFQQLRTELTVGRGVEHPCLRVVEKLRVRCNLLGQIKEAALLMEYFDGLELSVRKPSSIAAALAIFVETAKALNALNLAGYVHCDIKPNNIVEISQGRLQYNVPGDGKNLRAILTGY